MADPILKLSTQRTRRAIEIDGERFELIDINELSITDQHSMLVAAKKFEQFRAEAGTLTDEFLQELRSRLDAFVIRAVPSLGVKLGGLADMQKVEILNAFLGNAVPKTAQTVTANSSSAPAVSSGFSEDISKAG